MPLEMENMLRDLQRRSNMWLKRSQSADPNSGCCAYAASQAEMWAAMHAHAVALFTKARYMYQPQSL